MADEILGSLVVDITGDYSELQSAIEEAESVGTAGAESISDAFNAAGTAADATSNQFSLFGEQVTEASAQMDLFDTKSIEAADSMQQIGDASGEVASGFDQLGGAANEAASGLNEVGDELEHVGGEAEESESNVAELLGELGEMAGIAISVEGLKELGEEALTAYAGVQTATIALTAMEGSAAKASETIEQLESLANQDALSFPSLLSAAQRMVAFGFAAEEIPGILNAAANAAAATGNGFDQVTNSIDRLVISGTAGARQLATLGLSVQNLAAVMGVSSDEVAADFKAMDPSDRLAIIEEALGKYAGVAQLTAQSISGEWQQLENATHQTFVSLGADIAPAASAIMSFAKDDVVPAVSSILSEMAGMATATTQFIQQFASLGLSASDLIGPLGYVLQYLQSLSGGSGFPTLSQSIVENITHWGALQAVMNGVSLVVETFTNQGPQITAMNNAIATSLANVTHSTTTQSQAYLDATRSSVAYSTALVNVIQAQGNAKTTYDASVKVLNALTLSYQNQTEATRGHIATLGDLARAQAAVDTATVALTAHGKNWADTLAGVESAAQLTVEKEQSLATALQQAQAAFDAGNISTTLFIDVYTKAQAAAKALGDTLINVEAEEIKLNQASVNAQVTYGAEKQIFSDLLLKYESGVIDLQELETAYKNVADAATKAGSAFYNQEAAMLAAGDAASKQLGTLKDNITTLGGLQSATLQTNESILAQADVFKTVSSEASAMGISITNVGGSYQVTAQKITPAIQSVIDMITKWMTAAGLNVSVQQQGFKVVTDATTGIVSYIGSVEQATGAVQAHAAAHTALKIAVQATGEAFVGVTGQLGDYIVTTQSGDSTIISFTDDLNDSVAALNDVATAAEGAASAVDDLDQSMGGLGGGSGGGGGGGGGGASQIAGIASFMKMFGATMDSVTAALGEAGYVSQGGSGYNSNQNYESVSDYNASITALAAQLNLTTTTTLDQFGNELTALGPPIKSTTAAATSTAAAVTTLGTAAAAAATATADSTTQMATSADAYGDLNDALQAAGLSYSDLTDAQQQEIEQQLQAAQATGATQQALQSMATSLVQATQGTGSLATGASDATAGVSNLGTSATEAATTISDAAAGISNAAVDLSHTVTQAAAVIQNLAPPSAGPTGASLTTSGPTVVTTSPGTQVYVGGANGVVNSDGSAVQGPGSTAANPLAGNLTLSFNMNGGMVVGSSGMQQFTQMMMPMVVTALRQAGAKV